MSLIPIREVSIRQHIRDLSNFEYVVTCEFTLDDTKDRVVLPYDLVVTFLNDLRCRDISKILHKGAPLDVIAKYISFKVARMCFKFNSALISLKVTVQRNQVIGTYILQANPLDQEEISG